jgi:hypothetical protein
VPGQFSFRKIARIAFEPDGTVVAAEVGGLVGQGKRRAHRDRIGFAVSTKNGEPRTCNPLTKA